jgi:hypothetical protein
MPNRLPFFGLSQHLVANSALLARRDQAVVRQDYQELDFLRQSFRIARSGIIRSAGLPEAVWEDFPQSEFPQSFNSRGSARRSGLTHRTMVGAATVFDLRESGNTRRNAAGSNAREFQSQLEAWVQVAVDLRRTLLHRTASRQVPLTGIIGNSGSKPGLPPQL